jgi:hypothetical protein
MEANIFSEEYIFFSDFLNHIFLLGIALKKRRANLSDAAKERVNFRGHQFSVQQTLELEPVLKLLADYSAIWQQRCAR